MSNGYALVLERILNAPREKVYRCWSEPELMKKWFAPKPWTTASVKSDFRSGGTSCVIMRSPEGQDFPNDGIYLEVVPNEKLVFTDAFVGGWIPKDGVPFMVAEIKLEDAGPGKTKYTATVRHWNPEARSQHEQMGFHQGWGQCAAQLEEVAQSL